MELFINTVVAHVGAVSRTIKSQYCNVGMANFVRRDGLGATAVMEIEV